MYGLGLPSPCTACPHPARLPSPGLNVKRECLSLIGIKWKGRSRDIYGARGGDSLAQDTSHPGAMMNFTNQNRECHVWITHIVSGSRPTHRRAGKWWKDAAHHRLLGTRCADHHDPTMWVIHSHSLLWVLHFIIGGGRGEPASTGFSGRLQVTWSVTNQRQLYKGEPAHSRNHHAWWQRRERPVSRHERWSHHSSKGTFFYGRFHLFTRSHSALAWWRARVWTLVPAGAGDLSSPAAWCQASAQYCAANRC